MMIKFCPKCGSQIDPRDRFCEQCGFDKSMVNAGNQTISTPVTGPATTTVEPLKPPVARPAAPTAEPTKPAEPEIHTELVKPIEAVIPPIQAEPVKPFNQFNKARPEPPPPEPPQPSDPFKVEKTPRKFPVLPVAIIAIVLIAGAASWIIYTRVIRHKAGIQRAVAPAAGIAQTKEAAGGSLTSSAPGDTTKQKNQQETAVASSSSKVLLQVGSEEETRDVNPRNPAKLRLNKQTMIVRITTDHYNQGKGTEFTGTISIRDNNGREAGTYSAVGKPGKNGAANSYWVVEPRRILPAGIYYIWDSNLATWSKTASGDAFVVVEGYVTE